MSHFGSRTRQSLNPASSKSLVRAAPGFREPQRVHLPLRRYSRVNLIGPVDKGQGRSIRLNCRLGISHGRIPCGTGERGIFRSVDLVFGNGQKTDETNRVERSLPAANGTFLKLQRHRAWDTGKNVQAIADTRFLLTLDTMRSTSRNHPHRRDRMFPRGD